MVPSPVASNLKLVRPVRGLDLVTTVTTSLIISHTHLQRPDQQSSASAGKILCKCGSRLHHVLHNM